MSRLSLLLVWIVSFSILRSGIVEAQHHHHDSRSQGQHRSTPHVAYPMFSYNGMYGHHHSHRVGGPIIFQPIILQPIQVVTYSYPVATHPVTVPAPIDPPKPTTTTLSTPAARLKSLDLQTRGDQRMREQKWADARLTYLNAVNAAPERAMPHFRLGLCFVVIQRYDQAIREIKRALSLDPSIARNGEKMDVIFGPEGKMISNSVISKMSVWLREDPTNSDRLFLFGVLLYLNSDPRARETLEAAIHSKPVGDLSYCSLYLENFQDQGQKGIPKLNDRPDPILASQPNQDLRFPRAPVPQPDAPIPMP